ncbi:MAG: GNAT family N-acetyltransferase [Bacteroidota bacterium]
MIRRAKMSEIDDILEITGACAKFMIENGIYQWNEYYPSRKAFEHDIHRNELYVKLVEGSIVGGIVISNLMDEEYVPVNWLTETGRNIYIHRLFVHPSNQGQGHALSMMDFAEKYAKMEGFISVRLDTFSQNKRNQKFYEARGYRRLDDIFLPKQSAHPFHCYELVL